MVTVYKKPIENRYKYKDDLESTFSDMTDEDEDMITKELLAEEYALIHG